MLNFLVYGMKDTFASPSLPLALQIMLVDLVELK